MAPSPTSALGGLGDIARPGPARTANSADDTQDKSSFSNTLQDVQSGRDEPPRSAASADSDDATPAPEAPRTARQVPLPTDRTKARTAETGNDLPPGGEELPVVDGLDRILASLGLVTESTEADAKTDEGGDATDAAALPQALGPGQPDNVAVAASVAAAAAASLAPRSVQGAPADDGVNNAITDVAAAPKREVPTTTQTLSAAALLSGQATAEQQLQDPGVTDEQASAVPMDVGADKAAPLKLHNLMGDRKSGEQSAGAALTDVAVAEASPTPEVSADGEGAVFRDTLKQLDATLSSPGPRGNDIGAVTGARDNGLRQYLDSSVNAAKVDVPVGKAGWSDAVAGKVMWMSAQNLSSAEIQLNPPDLGPMSVRVSAQQDQTSVYFTSAHASVREALDQSLPRLREIMSSQGIQLGDVGVGGQGTMREQHAFANSHAGNGARGGNARNDDGDMDIANVARAPVSVRARPGLLDAYA